MGIIAITAQTAEIGGQYLKNISLAELLPFAKAVSAKSHDFDENGNEIHTDFLRVMKMVKEVGYNGFVGIEYEGSAISEDQGVQKTYDLLIKVGRELS